MTRCRPPLIMGPLRVVAAAPLTNGPPCWTKADEEEEEAKENSLLEEDEEEVKLEDMSKEELPANSRSEKKKAELSEVVLRPNETFVGPYRSSWDGLAQEEMWNQQWDHERICREGLKEEKQLDKTWREEADHRNRLFKKGLRIRKRKQLEAQALAAASFADPGTAASSSQPPPGSSSIRNVAGSLQTPSQRSVRPRQEVSLTLAGQPFYVELEEPTQPSQKGGNRLVDDPVPSLGKRDGSGRHKHNHGLASPPRARLLVALGVVMWGPERVASARATRRPQITERFCL